MLLEALPLILKHVPTPHVLIAGDGIMRGEMENGVSELGIRDCVHFMGMRDDARAIMTALNFLVLPSLVEGTPRAVMEAMMAGIPVVASAVGGVPEEIRHGQDGLLVPPGEPEAFAQACIELLRDPERARRMGEAGKERACREYDLETMVTRIEDLYRTVARESRFTPSPETVAQGSTMVTPLPTAQA